MLGGHEVSSLPPNPWLILDSYSFVLDTNYLHETNQTILLCVALRTHKYLSDPCVIFLHISMMMKSMTETIFYF